MTDYSASNSQGNSGSASGGPDTAATGFSFGAAVSGSSSYTSSAPNDSAAASNANAAGTLQQLLAELNQTTLLAQKEAATLLQGLSDVSAKAKAAAAAKQSADATAASAASSSSTPAASGSGNGSPALTGSDASGISASNAVSIEIGISQTISLQRLDANGYGDTLYKRPDGSLGKISTQPTHVTA